MSNSEERDALAKVLRNQSYGPPAGEAQRMADAILAAGYRQIIATEWETPTCHLDEWGKVEHSVNCECWAPLDRPKLTRRRAGPWVEAKPPGSLENDAPWFDQPAVNPSS